MGSGALSRRPKPNNTTKLSARKVKSTLIAPRADECCVMHTAAFFLASYYIAKLKASPESQKERERSTSYSEVNFLHEFIPG